MVKLLMKYSDIFKVHFESRKYCANQAQKSWQVQQFIVVRYLSHIILFESGCQSHYLTVLALMYFSRTPLQFEVNEHL